MLYSSGKQITKKQAVWLMRIMWTTLPIYIISIILLTQYKNEWTIALAVVESLIFMSVPMYVQLKDVDYDFMSIGFKDLYPFFK